MVLPKFCCDPILSPVIGSLHAVHAAKATESNTAQYDVHSRRNLRRSAFAGYRVFT
jgi:hypothetical protein